MHKAADLLANALRVAYKNQRTTGAIAGGILGGAAGSTQDQTLAGAGLGAAAGALGGKKLFTAARSLKSNPLARGAEAASAQTSTAVVAKNFGGSAEVDGKTVSAIMGRKEQAAAKLDAAAKGTQGNSVYNAPGQTQKLLPAQATQTKEQMIQSAQTARATTKINSAANDARLNELRNKPVQARATEADDSFTIKGPLSKNKPNATRKEIAQQKLDAAARGTQGQGVIAARGKTAPAPVTINRPVYEGNADTGNMGALRAPQMDAANSLKQKQMSAAWEQRNNELTRLDFTHMGTQAPNPALGDNALGNIATIKPLKRKK